MIAPEDLADQINEKGFAVISNVIVDEQMNGLILAVERAQSDAHRKADGASLRRGQSAYGLRDLLGRVPEVRLLAGTSAVRSLIEPILGPDAFAVRGLWFDKTNEANWNLPWHRDLTIAARSGLMPPAFLPGPSRRAFPTPSHRSRCWRRCSRFGSTSTRRAQKTVPCASCPARIVSTVVSQLRSDPGPTRSSLSSAWSIGVVWF